MPDTIGLATWLLILEILKIVGVVAAIVAVAWLTRRSMK